MNKFETIVDERVFQANNGINPTAICKLPSGWAVLGDEQHLPGYSFLLPDPVVPSINHLSLQERTRFLIDMTILGDALLEVCKAERINYEILGNTDPALHAHVIPRYSSEPPEKKRYPSFVYHKEPNKVRFDAVRDAELINNISLAVKRLLAKH